MRSPRIISRTVQRQLKKKQPRGIEDNPLANFPEFPPAPLPDERDAIYDIIYQQSVKLYRFTDTEYGIPWIDRGDIEIQGGGIIVIRFRCPINHVRDGYFGDMAKDVCALTNNDMHFFHEIKKEFNIPYAECVWVLNPKEGNREIEDEYIDESTVEEIDARYEEALEQFV